MRPELPSMTALLAFDASLRYGSFTRAAEELGRTQGAVSRQVSLLEAQLSVELFSREGARLRPTAVGKSFGAKLRVVLDRLTALTLEVQASGGLGATLNLAVLPSFGTRWLIPRIPGFHAANPTVRIHLSSRIGTFDFDTEGFDAAIHHGEPHWPGARLDRLMTEDVVVVCVPNIAAQLTAPGDLLRWPLLQLESRRRAWSQWFKRVEVDVQAPLTGPLFEHHLMVIQAALAGLGVALIPSLLIQDELATRKLVDPFPDLHVPGENGYYLAYPESSRSLPSLIAFRKWLLEELSTA